MVNSSMEKVQPSCTVTNLGLIRDVGKISLHSPTPIDLMSGTSHAELKVPQLFNQNFHIYNYTYTRFRFRGNLVDLGAVLTSFLGSKRIFELTLDSFTSTIINKPMPHFEFSL